MTKRISPDGPDVRAVLVRTVPDHWHELGSQRAANQSIASKIGCSGERPRNRVRQTERDDRVRVNRVFKASAPNRPGLSRFT
jgi:hypothetical protein